MDMRKVPYFREREVQAVLYMLNSSRGVAVLGRVGAGKSSFMAELHRYCVENHILVPDNLLDGKRLTNPDTAAKEAEAIIYAVRQQSQRGQSVILPIDGADYLYTPKGEGLDAAYGSPAYAELRRAYEDAEEMKKMLERLAREKFDPDINFWKGRLINETRDRERDLFSEDALRERYISFAKSQIRTRVICCEQCAQTMRYIGDSLESGEARLVLTLHDKFGRGSRRYAPDSGLGQVFEQQILPHLVDFELPEAYEPDKARLYLQLVKGIRDPKVVETVLHITGGVQEVMKRAVQGDEQWGKLGYWDDAGFEASTGFRFNPFFAEELEKMGPETLETELRNKIAHIRRTHEALEARESSGKIRKV